MTKTPEQMADEYRIWVFENDHREIEKPGGHLSIAFLAGYQAAKDEEATKDQKIAELWAESIKKMLPSVHEVVLFPGNSTKASEANRARDKDRVADASKVMNSPEKPDSCEHILDMEKMVDVNHSSGWISVKERLPEGGVGWTTVYGCILSRWAVQPGFYTKDSGVWVSRFVDEDEGYQNYVPFESVTHWMPLPKPPEDK